MLALIATPGVVALVALQAGASTIPWVAFGGVIVFYVLMFAGMIPRRTTLEVVGRQVRVPWRELAVARVEVGRWLMAGVDTPMGPLLELVGDDGARLRIGGEEHDARGFAPGRGRRAVDVALAAADFDALAATLGVARAGGLTVELVASAQTGRGVLRMMLPWLATIAVVSVLAISGVIQGTGDAIVAGGVIAVGLAVTIGLSLRPRRTAIAIAVRDDGLAIGDDVTPWPAVRAGARAHAVRMQGSRWTMPALELALGDRTIVFCAWGGKADGEAPRLRRAPRWLAGPAQFASLVAELRRRGALT